MKKFILVLWCFFWVLPLFSESISSVINSRGNYRHRATVSANPTDANDAVIRIETSHVVLDFEGFCIGQDSNNTVTGLSGVEVASNVEDICIRNGTILGVRGYGIKVNDGANNIKLENMIIESCDQGGIFLEGLSTGTGINRVVIDNCFVISCTGFNSEPAFGLRMEHTEQFIVQGCNILSNDASETSTGYGLYAERCMFGKIIASNFNENGGDHLAVGCFLLSSSNVVIKDCSAVHSIARDSASASFAAGFYCMHSDSIILEDCRSIENIHSAQKSVGYRFESGTGNIIKHSYAENNSGGTVAVGFEFIDQEQSIIENCGSSLNSTITTGTAFGILLAGSLNNNCYIGNNDITNNNGASATRGIEDERDPSTSLFLRNSAFNNGTNYTVSYPSTITLPTIEGSLSNDAVGLPSLSAGDLDNLDVSP